MTAEERAEQLIKTPIGKRPELATRFLLECFSHCEMCYEIWMWAFSSYAQCVEGLPCTDELYRVTNKDREWFEKNKQVEEDF